MVFDQFKQQLPDLDPQETDEWIDLLLLVALISLITFAVVHELWWHFVVWPRLFANNVSGSPNILP